MKPQESVVGSSALLCEKRVYGEELQGSVSAHARERSGTEWKWWP